MKRAFLTAATVASALAVAPAALADDPPKPPRSNGAVSVYVEQIPTSKGTVAAGASNNSSRALPPKVEKKLQSQPKADADRLKTIATSSGYGAPQTSTPTATAPAPATPAPTAKRAKPKPKPKRATKKPATTTPIQPQTPTRHPDATASAEPVAASDDGGRGMLVAALVGLAALAAAGAAVALRRGRSARPRTR